MEQRPQPLEQAWEKGQAHCVLIPQAPHSLLDKAVGCPKYLLDGFGSWET